MILKFRNIRRRLLSLNKGTKYVTYAFGEIFLVVIGILIAVQLNNWNEENKRKEAEFYMLNEVLNNLEEDADQISNIIRARERGVVATETLLRMIRSGDSNPDSLAKYLPRFLTFERYFPVSNAYEMIKSSGLKISNKDVRTQFSRYYDFEQMKILTSAEDIEQAFENTMHFSNPVRDNITVMDKVKGFQLKHPHDPVFLEQLTILLVGFQDNNGGTLSTLLEFYVLNQELIQTLKEEIQSIKE